MSDGDHQKSATQEHYENLEKGAARLWVQLKDRQPPIGLRLLIKDLHGGFDMDCREGPKLMKGIKCWMLIRDEDGEPVPCR